MMLGDELHRKTTKIHVFLSNLPKRRFILMFWRYILTFNTKTKTFKTITKLTGTIPLKFSIYDQTAEICPQTKIILYINTITYQHILNAMDEIPILFLK